MSQCFGIFHTQLKSNGVEGSVKPDPAINPWHGLSVDFVLYRLHCNYVQSEKRSSVCLTLVTVLSDLIYECQ